MGETTGEITVEESMSFQGEILPEFFHFCQKKLLFSEKFYKLLEFIESYIAKGTFFRIFPMLYSLSWFWGPQV